MNRGFTFAAAILAGAAVTLPLMAFVATPSGVAGGSSSGWIMLAAVLTGILGIVIFLLGLMANRRATRAPAPTFGRQQDRCAGCGRQRSGAKCRSCGVRA